ncbi:MAG TPA: glycosyltransferase family 9 protein [Bryobacteraceae bacterium]|nr:glycosyltransferase family 9 protein [Bryobacteraceae bacterium]
MEHLRADYTEVWVAEPNVPLIRFADKVRSIGSTGLDRVELGLDTPALEMLRSFDSIVSWYGSNRSAFRDAMAGFPITFHDALPRGGAHATDFYMEQVGGREGAIPRISCRRRRIGFVAVHPFSGSPGKNWPLENFRALARSLPWPVCFTAGPDEPLEGAVRFNNLYELACWLAEARLYIGNDSGITHLAAAVGTPVLAIFGPTDPLIWAPRGSNVQVLRNPSLEDCLSVLL